MFARLRSIVPLAILTAIPIVPFLLWGEAFERTFAAWKEDPPSAGVVAAAAIGLLACDVFLPVPASVVCTLTGARLGWAPGGVVNWTGMTLGAVAAFAAARRWGPAFARRFSSDQELADLKTWVDRWGAAVLIATRGLPVLAEATVLWLGMNGMSWRSMAWTMAFAHAVLGIAYAVLGHVAVESEWLPTALVVAAAAPVAALALTPRGAPSEAPARRIS